MGRNRPLTKSCLYLDTISDPAWLVIKYIDKDGVEEFVGEIMDCGRLTIATTEDEIEAIYRFKQEKGIVDKTAVAWRDRLYYLVTLQHGLILSSRDPDVKSSETSIYNFTRFLPCIHCTDPNIQRHPEFNTPMLFCL